MQSYAIIRVVCDDGPCRGLQYMDADTGRILFSDSPEAPRCVYALNAGPATTARSLPRVHLVDIAMDEAHDALDEVHVATDAVHVAVDEVQVATDEVQVATDGVHVAVAAVHVAVDEQHRADGILLAAAALDATGSLRP